MEVWRYLHQTTLRFLSLMDSLCEVSPKHSQDKSQRKITSNRTKAVIISHVIGIIIYIIQSIRTQTLTINTAFGIASNSLICTFAILSCRYHPKLLTFFYNIFMATLGPNLMDMGVHGFHRSWVGVQTYPILVLLVTGSLWHFLFQAILQLIFVNTIYQSAMINSVTLLSPEDFTRSISGAMNGLGFINIVSVTCIQIFLQNAYKKISIVEQKNVEIERQKTFLLGFSHELRNLINSVMGNVKLASMENLSERAKDFLRNADVCGELLLHLINNILDTGKVEVNDLEINPTPTDIYGTIERTWSICAELIRRKGLLGSLKIQNNLPKAIRIDHYRLTQIFLNIVGNAVKFTDRGSIDITVEWIDGIEEVKDEHFEPHPYDECDLSEGTFEKKPKTFSLEFQLYHIELDKYKDKSKPLEIQEKQYSGHIPSLCERFWLWYSERGY
jgi:signal transduction histidine kinase